MLLSFVTPNFNFSDSAWISTHELSHFRLFYLGYETSIIESLVHANGEAYDSCRENWVDQCIDIVKKLRTPETAYSQSVMPVYQPAVENSTDSQIYKISDEMIELSKLITQW